MWQERIVKERLDKSNGYISLHLNKKKFYRHRINALQFINNPDPEIYKYVDHRNHIKTDNRLENLRFVSNQQNCNNKSNQNFVNELPDDAIVVDKYNNHEFEFLYFSLETNRFYFFNGINYNMKPIYKDKHGYYRTLIYDKTNKQRTIYYNKFKKQYDLI